MRLLVSLPIPALALVLFQVVMSATLPTVNAEENSTSKSESASAAQIYQERSYTDPSGTAHRYRLLLPENFESPSEQNKKYPVVLFLHGAGERGDDNLAQLKHVAGEFARPDRRKEYPAIVIVPQCPTEKRWVEVDWSKPEGKGEFPPSASPAMETAMGMLKTWTDSGRADLSRIYIAGLSMGGYGTWYASAIDQRPFAAAVPICGGGDPDWAQRYAGLPIWTFHGDADTVVPVSRSREMIAALKAAKQTPEPIYTEIAGGPHDVWTNAFKRDDLFQWLFSQRKQ